MRGDDLSPVIDSDGRAAGAVFLDEKGARQRIRAKVTVVACSAVETARLLLLSATSGHASGLANSSGLVGKNLMFSSFASAYARLALPTTARTRSPGTAPPFGANFTGRSELMPRIGIADGLRCGSDGDFSARPFLAP